MKVILSRKGFDSSAGGMMSPIMENDDLLSLPIPIGGENKTYGEVFYGKRSLRDLLVELNPRFNFCDCHLDPDIEESRHACKLRGWRPAFGQCGAAATTLKRLDVGEGDVFLFFGNFHRVARIDGRLQYVRKRQNSYSDSDLHVIWGYLEVGKVLTTPDEIKDFVPWHPHATSRYLVHEKNNVVYLAKDRLTLRPEMSGAGLLKFDPKRVLTKEGESRSVWKLNAAYAPSNLMSNWRKGVSKTSGGIRFNGQWQEMILQSGRVSDEFVKRVILED